MELVVEVKALNLGFKNIQKLKKFELLQIISDNPVRMTEPCYPIFLLQE
tara:strand:+ start:122 stop:268 length:147 start_codon:yes stop_codon:yes gene_type:complete